MDEQKAKNPYRVLINDQKSIFYVINIVVYLCISFISFYPKDKCFVKIYNEIDNNDKKTNIINEKPPLNIPFVEK